ncbi:integrase catalytic region [Actinobaculum suis]|uniref:Integrase catalytic region n=2 Tax=Actinobaculum suis TaxID=1657 RepID=A0A7Z9C8W8_9ACTO|nr:IS3 family transposase [Actinobaculum suis]VDG75658.1 integrase catalytic region [Actinobaculum suis]
MDTRLHSWRQFLGFTGQGYYAWRSRSALRQARAQQRRRFDEAVAKEFENSRQTYGAPRLAIALRRRGIHADKKTVARSMKRQGLQAISARSFRRPGRREKTECDYSDHCERKWDKGALDRVWITDFTYLRSGEGWVYLVAIRDAHSRRVLGYAMSDKQTTQTVLKALDMAIGLRGQAPRKLVLHADRGAQFTSKEMGEYMERIDGHMSMGRTGVCWDNAMAEAFWAILKVEHFYRYAFATRKEVYESVSEWIEVFYNRTRIHTAIGGHTPVEYELITAVPFVEAA